MHKRAIAAGRNILYIRVVSVFKYSLLKTLQRWIGEIRYPIRELIKRRLVKPRSCSPVKAKNDSTSGYERATAPRLYPVRVPRRSGMRITMKSAGNARFCIVSVIKTCIWEMRIISRRIIIPNIAMAKFHVNDFFMIPI